MISDNDAHSADGLYDQHYYNKLTRDYKPGGSNRENKDSLQLKKVFNATKNISHKSKILLSSTGFAD